MIRILAAFGGLLAVAIGAFGAHALVDPQAKAWVATAATYGLAHAIAALWAADRHRWAGWLWAVGSLLFAGSLYALALGVPRWVAMAAPVGGGLMLLGWALLVAQLARRPAA